MRVLRACVCMTVCLDGPGRSVARLDCGVELGGRSFGVHPSLRYVGDQRAPRSDSQLQGFLAAQQDLAALRPVHPLPFSSFGMMVYRRGSDGTGEMCGVNGLG